MDNQDTLPTNTNSILSEKESAITLELANIMGGVTSSTLAMLIEPSLELGPPVIEEYPTLNDLLASVAPDSVMATFEFQNGFQSPVACFLEVASAVALANAMLGSEEANAAITDIQLSAFGEAISQMMGAAANSISQFLSKPVDISPPQVLEYSANRLTDIFPQMANSPVLMFRYTIAGSQKIPESSLIQIMPIHSVQDLISVVEDPATMTRTGMDSPLKDTTFATPPMTENPAPIGVAPMSSQEINTNELGFGDPVTVRPVEYPSFDSHISAQGGLNKNLELVMDVCLNLTVELGRTELPIKDVLELTRGSVIELNRIAGESVDLYANGKMIAKGEVVVIEDNFGLRITSIVSPADRLRGL